jgi:phosphate transport system protein
MDNSGVFLIEDEIEEIRSKMLLMGGMVLEMIKNSLDGLLTGSEEPLIRTFKLEEKVNYAEVEVDQLCNNIIVLRAPTASDLRFVLSTLRMLRDIERIGDEAEKMARMAQYFHKSVHTKLPKIDFSIMVVDVVSMLKRVLDAYARDDDTELRKVITDDKVIDETFRKTLHELMTYMLKENDNVGCCIDLIFFAKALERIGDHAKNMSESIIFMIKGKDLRHRT